MDTAATPAAVARCRNAQGATRSSADNAAAWRESTTSRDTCIRRPVESMELVSNCSCGGDQRARRRARWRTRSCSRCFGTAAAAAPVWVSIFLLVFATLSTHVHGAPTVTTTISVVPVSSLDFDAMNWTQWGDLYDTSAAAMTLERVYKSSPRVRAKLLVATQISMNQFLAGEAILRQQLSEIAGTSVARVQLEFLQTSSLRESDRGVYFAAFGVSALRDPPVNRTGTSDNSSTATAIEQERERIIQRLRYGTVVRNQNVTIASLALFGTVMELVDVALDGELFYPIDLKPWIAARIAVIPAAYNNSSSSTTTYNVTSGSATATVSYSSSTTTASTDEVLGLYTPSRDAYQSLRLRFLLTKMLLPLQLGTSNILIRETHAAPFASYHSRSASVVEIEIHLNDESFRVAVDGYLRNGSLAQEFSVMEPQWAIGAIDVDPLSGILFSPPSARSSTSSTSGATAAGSAASALPVSSAIDVDFVLNNVSFAHVASRKWRILERTTQFLSLNGCGDCQVSIKEVGIPSSDGGEAIAAPHNDGDNNNAASTSALDPINASSTTLSFRIDTLSSNASSFIANLQTQVASGPSTALCIAIGVNEESDTELLISSADAGTAGDIDLSPVTCALTSYQNATQLSSQSALTTEPFVHLNLTLGLTETALNASVTTSQASTSPFDQHHVRCALLVLFQQVAVYDKHLRLEATSEVPQGDPSAEPLLLLSYKVTIQDESQRQGIALLFLSKRLQRTIDEYTSRRLNVADRVADLHADGSPWLGAKLPGIALPSENRTAPALLRSGSGATVPSNRPPTRFYRYQDPLQGSNPSVLAFSDPSSTPTCRPSASTTSDATMRCVSIQFTSDFESNALFLREIESDMDISSPSLMLPSESRSSSGPADMTVNVPGPWVSTDDSAAANPWIFYATMSSQTISSGSNNGSSSAAARDAVVLRFHFEGYDSAGQSNPTFFTLAVRIQAENPQITVRKSSFLPLVASAGGNASSAYGHYSHFNPFVTALIANSNATNSTSTASNSSDTNSSNSVALGVAFRIHRSSIGGFFNRARIASEPGTSPSSSSSLCSACYAKLEACDASLECRALSACFSAYVDSNPALYASLLLLAVNGFSSPSSPVTHDVSWLLEQCLGGQQASDNRWTYSVVLQFLDGFLCTSSAQCPVDTSAAIAGSTNSSSDTTDAGDPGQSLVLRYTPMEQTLTFASVNFTSTLEFLIVTEDNADTGDGTGTSARSQVFSNLTRDDSLLSALSEMLMGLFRGQQSSASTNSSSSTPFVRVVRGSEDTTGSNGSEEKEVLRIQYFFLPTWTSYSSTGSDVSRSELLPYVQTVLGDSPIVKTVSPVERLELVVVDA